METYYIVVASVAGVLAMRLARSAWQNTCTSLMCKKDRDGLRGVIVNSLAVTIFVLGVKSGATAL